MRQGRWLARAAVQLRRAGRGDQGLRGPDVESVRKRVTPDHAAGGVDEIDLAGAVRLMEGALDHERALVPPARDHRLASAALEIEAQSTYPRHARRPTSGRGYR